MTTHASRGRLLALAVLFIVLGCAAGLFVAWQRSVDRPLREARTAYQSRDYALALRWANWQLRTRRNDLEAFRIAARCSARLGEYERAEALFQQIPLLEPEDNLLLGFANAQLRRFEKARPLLETAIDIEPTAEARRILAVVYNELGLEDLALAQAQLVATDPVEGDRGLALLGELYSSRRLHRESYDAYRKLLERNPQLEGVPQNRYHVLLRQIESLVQLAEHAEAAKLVEQLGDISQDATALRLRAALRRDQGQFDAAEQDWNRVLELTPGDAETMMNLGLLKIEQRAPEQAVEWLRRAAATASDVPAIHQHLAVVYSKLGNAAEAEKHRQIARQLQDQIDIRNRNSSDAQREAFKKRDTGS